MEAGKPDAGADGGPLGPALKKEEAAMEWYWWALIVVAVAAIGYLKLKVWGKIMASMKAKKAQQAEIDDE